MHREIVLPRVPGELPKALSCGIEAGWRRSKPAAHRLPRAAPVPTMLPKLADNLRASPSSSIDLDAAMLSASRKSSTQMCLTSVPDL